MKRSVRICLAALALVSAHAQLSSASAADQAAAQATAAPAKAERKPLYITLEQINVVGIVPKPTPDGSVLQKSELAELHRIQDARTPADLAQAVADDKQEDIFIFSTVLGPEFKAEKFPQTAELNRQIRNDVGVVESWAKEHFLRLRPWAVDPSIKGCPVAPNKPPKSSYPSGHASSGYALGVALAAIVPEKAEQIMSRAQAYAENRLVCGVHYRSDLTASQVLATVTVREMMHADGFKAQLAAARAELQAAGLAQ